MWYIKSLKGKARRNPNIFSITDITCHLRISYSILPYTRRSWGSWSKLPYKPTKEVVNLKDNIIFPIEGIFNEIKTPECFNDLVNRGKLSFNEENGNVINPPQRTIRADIKPSNQNNR
jgi:hypothetical protein